MKVRKIWAVTLFLLAFSLSLAFAGSDGVRTYSDIRVIEETGDLVGTELTVQVENDAATATLHHYEGMNAESIRLTGRLSGNTLELSGPYSEGTVEISACIAGGRLRGRLLFRMEEQVNEVQLDLLRVDRREK